jgi:hypothetical protein
VRTYSKRLRALLAVLLATSGVLFAVGSTIERHQHSTEHHAETTPASTEGHSEADEDTGTEGGSGATQQVTAARESGHESGVTILGIDTESVELAVLATLASLALALLVWSGRWSRPVLAVVVAFALVFVAGDARELAHQLDEGNDGLAALVIVLIALHAAVCAVAAIGLLAKRGEAQAVHVG